MNIAKIKMDDKGRITLPSHFLKANNIRTGGWVIMQPVYNNSSACKLKFKPRKKEVTDGVEKNNG